MDDDAKILHFLRNPLQNTQFLALLIRLHEIFA